MGKKPMSASEQRIQQMMLTNPGMLPAVKVRKPKKKKKKGY